MGFDCILPDHCPFFTSSWIFRIFMVGVRCAEVLYFLLVLYLVA